VFRVLVLCLIIAAAVPLPLPAPGIAAPARLAVQSARLEPAGSLPVAAPITLTVQFDQPVLLASWQWLGADGQPVPWGSTVLAPSELHPASERWVGHGAVPPLPGRYGVRVVARATGANSVTTLTLDLSATVVADPQPISRGRAFVRDQNIWLRAWDGTSERAVTFYGQPTIAGMPAWAPDGRWIAFIRDAGTVDSAPALWLIRPDGSGARPVAAPTPGQKLAYPTFAPDGTLYVAQSRTLLMGGVELGESWDLQQVAPGTDHLTPVLIGAEQATVAPTGRQVAFIRHEIDSDSGTLTSLGVANLDGSNERVLVGPSATVGVYAPAWSPDSATLVFAGQSLSSGGVRPQGMAAPLFHGGIWDLWTIPAAGGTPRLLSAVQEDLPYPQWAPDGTRVLFLSPTGLWSVPAAGGPAQQIGASTIHSELSIFAPVRRPAAPSPGAAQCFAQTGHCLRGRFLSYWTAHGGLAQFGYPISDELIEEGRTVQYTERARLEWHPEYAGSASEVLLGLLGADLAAGRADAGAVPFQRVAPPVGASGAGRYFSETGHTLSPPLRAYWERGGGLPVFGYPLSEAFNEVNPSDGKTYLVQYFERNRLEYHPEYAGTPSEMLLGLLGVQELDRRYGP
jgi:Tol biopolymer transport system component